MQKKDENYKKAIFFNIVSKGLAVFLCIQEI